MSRRLQVHIALAISVALGALLLSACGSDDDATAAGGATTVKVELQEWLIVPDVTSVPEGEVTFAVDNIGDETHEFVVLKSDLETTDLPTAEDGSVEEETAGLEVVDEAEDVAPGASAEFSADLASGSYIFLCNIVEEDGNQEVHFDEGMVTAFTVE